MIVEPTLLDHPKFLRLARRIGQGQAIIMLLRLWGHCQAECRREFWAGADAEYVEAVGRWDGESGVAFEALKATGFVVEEPGGVRIHDWDDMNASMLQRWDVGRKGGRKRSENRPVNREAAPGSAEPPKSAPPVNRPVNREAAPGIPVAPPIGDERRGEDTPLTPSGGEATPQQPVNGSGADPEPDFDQAVPPADLGAIADADRVWSIWPKRIDGLAALREIQAAIRRDGLDKVLAGTRAIVEADAKRASSPRGRYLPRPTEFFGNSRYLDDPAQYGPREGGANGSVPLGIRVRELSAQLSEQAPDSRDWWKIQRELQALRLALLSADTEPLGVRLREGVELLKHHPGNPDNTVGSLEAKRRAEPEFRELRGKVKALQRRMRDSNGVEVEP